MRSLKKALTLSAFFLGHQQAAPKSALIAFCLLCAFPAYSDDCQPPLPSQSVMISSVVDGDTVRLADGRTVRLIGVNTPELYSDSVPQAGALEAKRYVSQLVGGQRVELFLGDEPKDRYGRTLAYLMVGGKTLSQSVIERGLGWAISVPPNDRLSACFFTAERMARRAKLNLWQAELPRAKTLTQSGFAVLHGSVSNIESTAKHTYIELDDRLAVRVPKGWPLLNVLSVGRSIEVRGWVRDRRSSLKNNDRFKPFLLTVNDERHITLRN